MINTAFTRKITFAAAVSVATFALLGQAQAASGPSAIQDEIKPPVFAFSGLHKAPATETETLLIDNQALPVWNDDYRPAPASFYGE